MRQSVWTIISSLTVILSAAPLYASDIIYQEDFESGLGGFTLDNDFGNGNGLWRLTTDCAELPGHSPVTALGYSDDATECTYNNGVANQGVATSPAIDLSGFPNGTSVQLALKYFLWTENSPTQYDKAGIEISENGAPFIVFAHNDSSVAPVTLNDGADVWLELTADLTAFVGSSIQLRFSFNTEDEEENDHPGFYVDDITISVSVEPVYHEDFESGLGGFTIDNASWAGNGLWHLSTACQSSEPGHSAVATLAYADDASCTYLEDVRSQGTAVSPVIDLSAYQNGTAQLVLNYFLETEVWPGQADIATVEISQDGGPFNTIAVNDPGAAPVTLTDGDGVWLELTADLSDYAGSSIQLQFGFDTVDASLNIDPGFYVDDITVLACPFRLAGDINGDCRVDLLDVAALSQSWLVDCTQNPLNPGCIPANPMIP